MKVTSNPTTVDTNLFRRGNLVITTHEPITIVLVTGEGYDESNFSGTELLHRRPEYATPGVNSSHWARDLYVQYTGTLTLEN